MSKKIVFALLLVISNFSFAQKPCELEANVTDSLGTYKTTKQQIVFERSFAGNSIYAFFNLASNNGLIAVDYQLLQKSNEFIKALCFDANAKIYLQLNNGKIVTLLYKDDDNCGSLIRDEKNGNNRVLTGTFLFSKENYQELKTSPVTYMRVRYAGETIDYPFKTSLISEMDKKTYEPENYFINNLKCIEN